MPIESPLPPFSEWFPAAAGHWLLVVGVLIAAAILFGFLMMAMRYGPAAAGRFTSKIVRDGLSDLFRMSPRRVGALAWLAVKESMRRRIMVVFAVFVLLLLFAGWFLDPGSTDPARLYLTFVLTATSYLVLLLALFLSAFSLPADLRSRTLHTIVTKPVRPSEIVLGRILGFTIVCTALLVPMCAVSYFFVVRGLEHSHAVTAENLKETSSASGKTISGYTESSQGHRHRIVVNPDGAAHAEMERGHWHEVTVDSSAGTPSYTLGGPAGMLLARVPVYGSLRFRDPAGADTEKGINVGDEWMYRSFIQGGSPAAAIWTFRNITEDRFAEGLPVELNVEVFRTFKGDIEKGVLGSLALRNPRTGLTVEVEIFESKDFVTLRLLVPREITKFSGKRLVQRKIDSPAGAEFTPASLDKSLADKPKFDLFQDLVADGEVELWLQCLEPSQYFGASMGDVYLRARDAMFSVNFLKGYLGIWLQMVLVIAFGVMFSTFLSGPVAMIATLGALVGGFFSSFMGQLSRSEVLGGGPFEALIRLVRQENLMVDLDPGLRTYLAKLADRIAEGGLRVISAIVPPFSEFGYATWVAYGFDVSWDPYIAIPMVRMLAFVIPVFVAGYFFLKTREVAR